MDLCDHDLGILDHRLMVVSILRYCPLSLMPTIIKNPEFFGNFGNSGNPSAISAHCQSCRSYIFYIFVNSGKYYRTSQISKLSKSLTIFAESQQFRHFWQIQILPEVCMRCMRCDNPMQARSLHCSDSNNFEHWSFKRNPGFSMASVLVPFWALTFWAE